ncbi:hypothetical protein [uncultured Tateyamaria sp.]|uniref:hypothetical protein n=1 Tax=Tateyamaria sp. 1078 TaxID=3417464 RepID=UPI00262A6E1C|nr:hypothetical protein [uncultured Tateyamaria sp.]
MTDPELAFGHTDGPREHWCAKVQIMGSPAQNWSLVFQPETIETFLRARMARVDWSEQVTENGETTIAFDYAFPPNWTEGEAFGSLRLAPSPGASFEVLSYGMAYDLLEELARLHPENTDMVVIFSEFRALFHKVGLPRDEGIFRLSDDVHTRLSRMLFPLEWGSEDQL